MAEIVGLAGFVSVNSDVAHRSQRTFWPRIDWVECFA
jgi:hypothetical protein